MIIMPHHIPTLVKLGGMPETALPAGQILRAGLCWRVNLEGFLEGMGGLFWEGLGSSNFEIGEKRGGAFL